MVKAPKPRRDTLQHVYIALHPAGRAFTIGAVWICCAGELGLPTRAVRSTVLLLALAVACESPDGGSDGDGGVCTVDADCADDLFCNGEERCETGTCVSGSPPCPADMACDEGSDTCGGDCPDEDRDGRRAIECGGDDCDDTDPERFPGNTEICDVGGVDEDCDPETYGFRDSDGDGSPDARCCNGDNCGLDCDDNMPGVNPSVPEVCGDTIDNDCDGDVDEGVVRTCYADDDGDGFAAIGAATMSDCSCPSGWTDREPVSGSADCNDDPSASGEDFYPGASELCDGYANGCPEDDALTELEAEDADGDMHSPADAPCTGGFPKDDCTDDHELVFTGQTTYFERPWCPRSFSGGDVFRIVDRGWFCSGTETTLPSFDYDCSGSVSPTPAFDGCESVSGDVLCLPDGGPGQCLGSGPTEPAGSGLCGETVSQTLCECVPRSGAITGARCEGSVMDAPLRCR